MQDFAIVIPAYNEAATVRGIAERSLAQCPRVIVIDDGSTDGTAEQLDGLAVTLLVNETNSGKAASLLRGLKLAVEQGAQAVITLDADGQHRPEDIPAFLAAASEHPDTIVIGSRLHDKHAFPRKRYLANRFANFWIAWASGRPVADSQSGFRLYPARLIRSIDLRTYRRHSFVFESEILIEAAWRGIGNIAVPIPAIYGDDLRESHFQSVRDIVRITGMVTRRLLRKGMNPVGFFRAFVQPAFRGLSRRGFDRDARLTLLLSVLTGVLTLGLTHVWVLVRVVITAWRTPCTVVTAGAIAVPGYRLKRGRMSRDYQQRLDRAAQLYAKVDPHPDIIIIGGRPHNNLSEAEIGRQYLVSQGVPGEAIAQEEESTNTLENLSKARTWLQAHEHVVVVSNRYHLERLRTLASGLGLAVRLCAAETGFHPLGNLRKLVNETIFLHWYWCGRFYATLTHNADMLERIR